MRFLFTSVLPHLSISNGSGAFQRTFRLDICNFNIAVSRNNSCSNVALSSSGTPLESGLYHQDGSSPFGQTEQTVVSYRSKTGHGPSNELSHPPPAPDYEEIPSPTSTRRTDRQLPKQADGFHSTRKSFPPSSVGILPPNRFEKPLKSPR